MKIITQEKKFKEELGIYYIEDLKNGEDSKDDDYSLSESDINKTQTRVITYTEIEI